MESKDGKIVRGLLAAAGIDPSADEVQAMTQSYAALRAAADGMYTLEAAEHLPAFAPAAPEAQEE